MGDRTRLFLTGIAAAGAVAVTFAAPKPWSVIHINDDEEQVSIPLASLRNFDGITLEGPDDVVVTQGNGFGVTLEGDKGAGRALNLYVKDGVLHVARRGFHWGGDATVHVTMPALKRLWLQGPGDMEVEQVQGKELRVLVAGSGDLRINNLAADNVALSLSGSGDVDMSGRTNVLDVNLAGSGDMQLGHLDAKTANITVNGSGSVDSHASGNARLVVSGSGDAHVEGTTNCQVVKSGSGDAECST